MTQTEPDIARPRAPCLHFPLAGTLQEAGGADALTVQGPHRFHRIGSTMGYQPLSLKTVCRLPTDLHLRNEGTISLWVSPLETLAVAAPMQREDFLSDHPPRTTGSMNTIINDRIRNYHWEFFRHSVDVRGDVDTQVLVKNPWFRPLALSSRPLPACGAWSQLLFLQEGDHLRAAINGEWLLDVHDSPTDNHGPVLNTGRIGIRLMYQTRMCFRNLKVWSRARDGKNVTHG